MMLDMHVQHPRGVYTCQLRLLAHKVLEHLNLSQTIPLGIDKPPNYSYN